MSYDRENIIAKILRSEIPCAKVFENTHALAFRDIAPQAPSHVLVVPKGAYASHDTMLAEASDEELVDFQRAIAEVVKLEGLIEGGYRLIMNNGAMGGQEIPHLHCHVLGGRALGAMLSKA